MIYIAAPGKAKIIGIKVNSLGLVKLKLLSTATNNISEKLVEKGGQSVVISKDVPPALYQNTIASIPTKDSVININYVTEKGASGRFATENQTTENQKLLPL